MSGAPSRVVLTRSREANRPWRERLAAAGLAVVELPLLRFEALPPPDGLDTGAWDWILFTSPRGADAFREAGLRPGGAHLGALGAGTAAALAACGQRDDLGANAHDGAGLARAFIDRVAPPARVLLPGSAQRLEEPRASLAAAGFDVVELPLYRTVPVPAAELPGAFFADGDVVFFCSPSAVGAFAAAYAERPPCAAIGETTAAACRDAGFEPAVADAPSLEGLALACGLALDPSPASSETETWT